MPSSPSFPENLRMYRRNHGLTQTALAQRLNFSPETISAWERGIRRPPIQQIPHLARMMGIEAEKLLPSIDVESGEEKESRTEQRMMISQQQHQIAQFESQVRCEKQIREAARVTRRAKILTIRGEKYFMGPYSLLYSLCERRSDPASVRVLVLSPESSHISHELAGKLDHESAEEIRDKMRHSLDNLKYHARRNKNCFEVRCYQESPNFKILLFDSVLFVSSFVDGGPKHDHSTPVYQMMREGNPLFAGFERYFDDLWGRSSPPE